MELASKTLTLYKADRTSKQDSVSKLKSNDVNVPQKQAQMRCNVLHFAWKTIVQKNIAPFASNAQSNVASSGLQFIAVKLHFRAD
eukprot:763676-Amphidinium_carterae.2